MIEAVDPVLRIVLTGIAVMLETSVLVGLVVPGDTVVIAGSTAISSPVEFAGQLLAVVVGALIGESIGFALGMFFGPRIRSSRLGRRIGEHNWVRAERFIARRGGPAVFMSRFLPVLHSLVPVTVGMSVMRYRTFIAWTLPACVLWAVAYVSVGFLAAGSYRELSGTLHVGGVVFVAILLGFAAIVFVAKKSLAKANARYMVRDPRRSEPSAGATPVVDE